MKLYFVDTGKFMGLSPVEAETLEDAKSYVHWDYANAGKVKLIEITYEEINRVEHILDTDYK